MYRHIYNLNNVKYDVKGIPLFLVCFFLFFACTCKIDDQRFTTSIIFEKINQPKL